MKTKRLAVIPARGGSKRIPNKNARLIGGKPMIAWTIEAAINAKLFDRIFISTDCEIIAGIGREYGLEIPFLRDQYADDFSTVSDVTLYAINQLKEKLNESFDSVAQLMPNCPLRSTETIVSSIKNFEENCFPSQISCFKFGWNNPWWAFTLDADCRATKLFPNSFKKRSQDLDELYCPTGAIWISRISNLIKSKTFYSDNHRFYLMPWIESLDIDTWEDWHFAEYLMMQNMNKTHKLDIANQ